MPTVTYTVVEGEVLSENRGGSAARLRARSAGLDGGAAGQLSDAAIYLLPYSVACLTP